MRNIVIGSLMLGLALSSCESSSSAKKISNYFDVAELFLSQAKLIKNVSFEKSASIDSLIETKTLKFDSLEWTKELSMFINMDINKAVLVGAFSEEKTNSSDGSSVLYKKKPEVESGVQWMKLDYDSQGNVVAFSGRFEEENALYQNSRELSATFATQNGMSTLESYSIRGFQKILMKDTVNYQIEAKALN
ncbi:MAG: hypothetical protein ACMVP2_12300 [Imperialibacter sp.]|uniref:hypothetical protein n=1 Tax=Imperialibacter sp. TaxID=2038411 RepID=UPI003A8A4772